MLTYSIPSSTTPVPTFLVYYKIDANGNKVGTDQVAFVSNSQDPNDPQKILLTGSVTLQQGSRYHFIAKYTDSFGRTVIIDEGDMTSGYGGETTCNLNDYLP